jgi:hypothetical protein
MTASVVHVTNLTPSGSGSDNPTGGGELGEAATVSDGQRERAHLLVAAAEQLRQRLAGQLRGQRLELVVRHVQRAQRQRRQRGARQRPQLVVPDVQLLQRRQVGDLRRRGSSLPGVRWVTWDRAGCHRLMCSLQNNVVESANPTSGSSVMALWDTTKLVRSRTSHQLGASPPPRVVTPGGVGQVTWTAILGVTNWCVVACKITRK